MTMHRRAFLFTLGAGALSPSFADTFPSKPITLIYNFAPGGPGDAVARYMAQQMGPLLGKQVIVENKTGGAGVIGILAAARAPADGYTILYTPVTGVVQLPLVTNDASFVPARDLVPIVHVGTAPVVIYAHPSVPANDVPSFLEWARRQPQGVDLAGAGPIIEVAITLLASEANLKLVYVPYRGVAPALQAVLAGDVKFCFVPPSGSIAQYVAQGKLKAIGVTTQDASPLVAGAQPIGRFVPNYVQEINFVLWAPSGVPADVMTRLTDAANKVLAEPGIAQRFQDQGLAVAPAGPAEVRRMVEREDRTIRAVVATKAIRFGS